MAEVQQASQKEAPRRKEQTQTNDTGVKEAGVIEKIVPTKEKRMAASAAEQYKKALEHAESIKQTAVEELRNAINSQIEELNSFGYDYRLTQSGKTATKKRAPSDKVKHCEICNMDGHDARNHRNQDPKKKFTKAELEEKGLTPTA